MDERFAWWAIREVSLDEVAARLAANGWIRDPRWHAADTFDGPPKEQDECTLVQLGDVALVCVVNDDKRIDEVFAGLTAPNWKLLHSYPWARITEQRSGTRTWSVMGDDDSDHVHSDGALPHAIEDIVDREEDRLDVAADVSERLLGIRVRDYEISPPPSRVLRFLRTQPEITLKVGDARTITAQPTRDGMALLVSNPPPEYLALSVLARTPERLLVCHYWTDAYEIDIAQSPPRFTRLSEANSDGATFTPWGTTLLALVDDSINSILVERGASVGTGPALPCSQLKSLHDVGVGVLVVPGDGEGERRPLLLRRSNSGTYSLTVLDVPPREDADDQACLAAPFGDGPFLLHWLGHTYRCVLVGTAVGVTEIETLPIEELNIDGAIASAGYGSLYVGTATSIVQLWSDGRRVEHDGFRNPCRIVRATNDMYIVVDFDEQAVGKLWWPGRGVVAPVPNEVGERFILIPAKVAYYDASRDQLVVMDDKRVRTVSLSSVPGIGSHR